MGRKCTLFVRQWAAVRQDANGEVRLGIATGEDIIPAGFRRRMGSLERLAVRCMLSTLQGGTSSELIFCSRYGNMETLASLLRSLAVNEPVSPLAFSGSVHNAAPGLVGQIRKEKISHTALAAGQNTLRAGLVEAYARLAADDCDDVIVAYADQPLADVFGDFDPESGTRIGLAMRVALEGATSGSAVPVWPGKGGALAVMERLEQGASEVVLGDEPWIASA